MTDAQSETQTRSAKTFNALEAIKLKVNNETKYSSVLAS